MSMIFSYDILHERVSRPRYNLPDFRVRNNTGLLSGWPGFLRRHGRDVPGSDPGHREAYNVATFARGRAAAACCRAPRKIFPGVVRHSLVGHGRGRRYKALGPTWREGDDAGRGWRMHPPHIGGVYGFVDSHAVEEDSWKTIRFHAGVDLSNTEFRLGGTCERVFFM